MLASSNPTTTSTTTTTTTTTTVAAITIASHAQTLSHDSKFFSSLFFLRDIKYSNYEAVQAPPPHTHLTLVGGLRHAPGGVMTHRSQITFITDPFSPPSNFAYRNMTKKKKLTHSE
ncbi:hypothetical protein E2C01_078324 [Portunus trituberculatus]|uniref:Uncharacterized protein n=1 Tax=Portunus trituberculatus TaxID=210409 RepID=A0A5B7IE07_PORTR|nr:hypothetical protein [Portunus trituberculatus]